MPVTRRRVSGKASKSVSRKVRAQTKAVSKDPKPAKAGADAKPKRKTVRKAGAKPRPGAAPHIVGIGASAGGLSAFKTFFANMPVDTGMAFVLVQHLAPDHVSMLTELLARATDMPVAEATDGMVVTPNSVFIIPPNATMTIQSGRLRITRPAPPRENRRPIDTFFTSLAHDQGENAVSIVLSGTGSDGALGLTAIKEQGGFTLAQAELDHSAMSGMPHSAVATGFVDEVLPVEAMPARLMSHQNHLKQVAPRKAADGTRADTAEHLATIAKLLRAQVGHDFSQYKEKTVTRRIQRRMQVLQIDDAPAYIARLKEDPHQLDLLFRELLISVTRFFRDPDAFAALGKLVFPSILANRRRDDPIRIWVPACATGEEVYSLAILAREAIVQAGVSVRVQIFGTDIDERAISIARGGRYVKPTGVSPERLERWFTEESGEFCLVKDIRDMCVFSQQSIVRDPPFSRLDLASCRNLLIYLDAALQDRVLRTLHYALRPGGFLFLGPSEGSRQGKLFASLDAKHRIFQRRDVTTPPPDLQHGAAAFGPPPAHEAARTVPAREDQIARKARQAVEKHSPAYVVINADSDILRFSGGEAGRYLEPSAGMASLNLFAILRKTLRPAVRAAVRSALATRRTAVHEDIAVRIDGEVRMVTVIVEPINGGAETGPCVVAFREAPHAEVAPGAADPGENPDIQALEHELRSAKTQLQSTIDELETANEEMRSAAEEYQSVNEELQSSNEELETSKEEMQSINEELQTVNAEIVAKNEALTRLNSDIRNLLDSTQIATLFLDRELRIKSFTPQVKEIFRLRDADVGRPITDIVTSLSNIDIKRDVSEILGKLTVIEREVQLGQPDMTFILRMRPYRTVDDVIDGVVMTFLDISERKRAEEHSALLLGELDHRVKNILAIVSSMVTQTLKAGQSPAAFAASFQGRIAAIARAHSLLTQSAGKGEVSLRALIDQELAPFNLDGQNLTISGPGVMLTPKAGLTLAIAIHELASNASKYGALSTPEGRLSVTWRTRGSADKLRLAMIWAETGGPTVKPPTRTGFGTTLIDRTLSYDLDGEVNSEFRPEGLRFTLAIPLTADTGRLSRKRRLTGKP